MVRKICLLLLLFGISLPVRVAGQTTIRTASPPIVKITLGPRETPPSNLFPDFKNYGFGGGPGDFSPERPIPSGLYWREVPDALSYLRDVQIHSSPYSDLVACGYHTAEPPPGILTLPSGKKETLEGHKLDYYGSEGCWKFMFSWAYGIELGLYTLTLRSNEGELSHTWGIDYPHCRTAAPFEDNKIWIMGFAAGDVLTAYFYASAYKDSDGFYVSAYVGTRTIKIESQDGSALVQIGFTDDIDYYPGGLRDGLSYVLLDSQGNIVDNTNPTLTVLKNAPELKPPSIPVMYPTYSMGFRSCNDQYHDFAQIATKNNFTAPVFTSLEQFPHPGGEFASGSPVELLDEHAAIDKGQVVVLYLVQTEASVKAWIDGRNLIQIYAKLIPSSQAIVLRNTTYGNGVPTIVKVYLYKRPQGSSKPARELSPGTSLVILQDRGNGWYRVRTEDNDIGWVYAYVPNADIALNIWPLPWKPVPLNDKPNP